MMNKAIFLDKDGTLIENVPYNIDPEKIRLYEDVPEALLQFKRQGFRIVVITNQPGVAYGYFEEDKLKNVKDALDQMFGSFGICMDGFYYCPHHKGGRVKEYAIECICRKPNPGMILQAADDLNIDLAKSWMIGDILNDVEAGTRAGCKTVLVNNGNETEWIVNRSRIPTYIVRNIQEAAEKITETKKEYWEEREKI